ncbi:MAG TPA: EAL domain-containing protein, partial [Nitrospirota bacterium]|nr:EAL domain-containing protein [Nitrospirota bacterium]
SFNGKYGVVVGVGLLAFIGIGVLLYESVAPVINAVETRTSAEGILMHLDGMLSGLQNLEANEREYVLSGRMNYRDGYQAAVNKIQQETAALKMLTVNYPEQQRSFALLEFQIVKRLEYSHQLIDVLEKEGRTSAENMVRTGGDGEIAENIGNTVSDMRNAQNELLKQQDRLINPGIRTSVTLIVISYLAAILIVLLFGAVALRESRLRRRAEEMRKRLSLTVDQATDLVVVTDLTGKIEYVNRAVEETTGYSASELLGKSRDLWYSGKHDAEFFQKKRDTVSSGGTFQATVTYRKKNGDLFYLFDTLTPLRDAAGNITHTVSTGRDITSQKSLEERVDYLAYFDTLTGVPNRARFVDRLQEGIVRAQGPSEHIAVLAIDIDRFKLINDVFGFDAGDELLKVITERLLASVGEGDTVARVGNDEFDVALHNIARPSDVVSAVNKIMKKISQSVILRGEEIIMSFAVGVTLFPDDGDDAETLIQNAHLALGKAKAQGKNNFQFYTPGIVEKASEFLVMEKRLSSALKKEEYLVYYQPYVDMTTRRFGGAEALIKWKSDKHGLVSPKKFIPMLEDTGMIIDVGEWVLKTACRQIKEWDQGKTLFPVAVNLSSMQFHHKYLVEMVENTIKESGVDPACLTLEVTEGIVMHDLDYTSKVLSDLKNLGVSISVDDFGTGYSSLSYLKKLPFDNVKIDMSFVKDITTDPDAASIVMAITSLARNLNLKTIAEGVETEEQWKILRLLRCDMGQGFYFSPALSPAEFGKLLV